MIAEEAAVPFATISGRETSTSEYKGIALDLMKVHAVVTIAANNRDFVFLMEISVSKTRAAPSKVLLRCEQFDSVRSQASGIVRYTIPTLPVYTTMENALHAHG